MNLQPIEHEAITDFQRWRGVAIDLSHTAAIEGTGFLRRFEYATTAFDVDRAVHVCRLPGR